MVCTVQFSSGRPAARASASIHAASRCLAARLEKETDTSVVAPHVADGAGEPSARSPRSMSTSRVRMGPRRSSRARQHQRADDVDDLVEDALAERSRRELAATP